jgi:hypothetical protein
MRALQMTKTIQITKHHNTDAKKTHAGTSKKEVLRATESILRVSSFDLTRGLLPTKFKNTLSIMAKLRLLRVPWARNMS